MTYTQLQADIADHMHRTDLTAKIPGFIALAESAMLRELNIKEIQTTATGTTIADLITLPADFGALVRLTTTVAGIEKTIDYVAPTETYANSNADRYGFESGGLRIYGAGTGTAYTLYYTPVIEPLSALVSTNWLLDNAPDLYLYASCVEAAKYIRDTEQVGLLSSVVAGLLDSVRRLTVRRFIPGGSLQIKPR